MNSSKSILIITHYQRLLDYIKPTYVHVMQNGKIIKTGTPDEIKRDTNTTNLRDAFFKYFKKF